MAATVDPDQDHERPPLSPPLPWPNRKEDYELLEVIGSGASSVVQAAMCLPRKEKVAVKRIDLEQYGSSIEELQKEISLMSRCNHPNVANCYTSFVVKDEVWLVMKLMSGGSLLDIIKHVISRNPKGGVLDEVVIATVLKAVLQGLDYFHANGQIHRDLKAGNILVGNDGTVHLADFGVSNWLYGETGLAGRKKKPRNTFVGTPCWMAPEVMDQSVGYDAKADIWSFGITALELATGTAPYAKFPPMKVIMLTLENPPPTLDTCCELANEDYRKNYSKSFQKMVEKCLQKDPEKRPTAAELLKLTFFKKAKGPEYVKEVVLGNAPSLQSRAMKVKRVPGTSGHLHKTEDGGWVWSDDELTEEYDPEEDGDKSIATKSQNKIPSTKSASSSSLGGTPSADSSTKPKLSQGEVAASQEVEQLKKKQEQNSQQLTELEEQIEVLKLQEQDLLTQQEQSPDSLEIQEKAMSVLDKRQDLERKQKHLLFQQQQVSRQIQKQGQPQPQTQPTTQQHHQSPVTLRLALRKRTENNQLKDIKFQFIKGKDSADAIAKELLTAGLVEGRNLVGVAANIQKLVDNVSLEKITFQLGNVPPEQADDKKLIGYAQLYIVQQ